ncbi:MAG: ABC-F family ATP-binding cassette domain-containing protein [Deltaproteobacteria bacterium]|nr:ABC-F family ATP-binding cassette domain-containing protein [Myxococcales bacterium]MDP3213342.1 ABC-F family ATP-binding cassette domain-containing protein [Deltaproteobacteria bacterium]
MIGTSNLGKSWGDRVLFGGVTLKLNPGSRYGLVGANGSGKTTFMKVLAGDEPATEGMVTTPRSARVGVLRQDRFMNDEDRILDVAMMGDEVVWGALSEQRRLGETGGDLGRIADLEDVIRAHDGYTLEARASFILEGLGIPVPLHRQALATLSGGFKLRVLLAQVLLGGPDALLLDEPTNHLDILSIRWLEKFLAVYKGCALVISHDQRFLDNVATHILDVDYGTITIYTGNYSAFEVEKRLVRERMEAQKERQEKIIAEKRAFVDRFGAKATKAKQAQSRLKQIEKIEVIEIAESSRQAPVFRFVPARPSGKDVLTVVGLSKSYGDKQVLKNVSVAVRRGERLAIIGPNGLGKSTLLKIAMGRLDPDVGRAEWGHEVRPGYFAQDHRDLLVDENTTPLKFIEAACPTESQTYVRGQLGRMLFSGDDAQKRVSTLSGGEAARLIFCRLMVEKPNVLVLDEPTNHLDLESIAALVEGLRAFEGTVIFVSHDRWFVSALATRILEVTPDGPRDFPGTYPEYLARCGDDHLDADAVVLKAKKVQKDSAPGAGPAVTALSWEEQKKRRNRVKDLPQRRDKALAGIATAEARRKAIADLYASDGFYTTATREQLAKLQSEDEALAKSIEGLMSEWEQIEQQLAAFAAQDRAEDLAAGRG